MKKLLDFVSKNVKKEPAFIAIDAPLVVPNKTGRRLAEQLVGDSFRKYNAGAHPSNRERLGAWSNGKIRGEEITNSLQKMRFLHDPYVKKYENSRKLFEVYPHPSMVVLFNLNKILQYKAKLKRDTAFRLKEFERYNNYLKGLNKASPSLKINSEFLNDSLNKLKLSQLKSYEDTLDAIFCAYIAYYYWVHPDNCAVLGTVEKGYIMTPIFEYMKGRRKRVILTFGGFYG